MAIDESDRWFGEERKDLVEMSLTDDLVRREKIWWKAEMIPTAINFSCLIIDDIWGNAILWLFDVMLININNQNFNSEFWTKVGNLFRF